MMDLSGQTFLDFKKLETSNLKFIVDLIKLFPRELSRRFIFLLFWIFSSSIVEILNLAIIGPFISVIINSEQNLSIFPIAGTINYFGTALNLDQGSTIICFFAFLIVLSSCLRLILLKKQITYSYEIGKWVTRTLYEKIISQPFIFHNTNSSSNFVNLITTKTSSAINEVISPFLNFVSSSVSIITIVSCLIYFNPLATLVTLSFFTATYVFVINFSKIYLRKHGLIINHNNKILYQHTFETLQNIREIILGNLESVFSKSFSKVNSELRSSESKVFIIAGSPRHLIEGLSLFVIASIAFLQVQSHSDLPGSITIIGVMIFSIQRLLPLLQGAYAGWTMCFANNHNIRDIFHYLMIEKRNLPKMKNISFKKEIFLNSISFRFNSSKLILNHLSLKISKGSKIGITGRSGCGKSTLLDIISGLITPIDGKILIDGIALDSNSIAMWRRKVAYIPQEINLLSASVSENVAFGVEKSKINHKLVYESVKKAQISDFFNSLPHAFDTVIGDGGEIKLSGGEKQRIGIARAFYREAELIIMDEATSALDKSTENEFLKIIKNLDPNITVILVSHHPKNLEKFDAIYKINSDGLSKVN